MTDSDSSETLSRHVIDLYRAQQHAEALALSLRLVESSQAAPWLLSMIGTMYFRGRGTARDQGEALRWFKRAADAGDPGALTFLSRFAMRAGRYNDAKAMLEDAALQGDGRALLGLGYLYDRGLGVRVDRQRARDYFEQAHGRGYVFAKRFIAGQLIRGDDGLLGIARGLLMFVSSVVDIVRARVNDPYSEKSKY